MALDNFRFFNIWKVAEGLQVGLLKIWLSSQADRSQSVFFFSFALFSSYQSYFDFEQIKWKIRLRFYTTLKYKVVGLPDYFKPLVAVVGYFLVFPYVCVKDTTLNRSFIAFSISGLTNKYEEHPVLLLRRNYINEAILIPWDLNLQKYFTNGLLD